MLFEVEPSQIEDLDSKQLVLLLRRLLYAEAHKAGLSLGTISVPLQITVPDGGEDGRIEWTEGRESTDYLPSRTTLFQSKASNIGPAGWRKECWTKQSQGKGKQRVLTDALESTIAVTGSYIGFTTTPLGGGKRAQCEKAIREGINEAGGDPLKLSAIRVYGSNEIAAWAEEYPAIALWLAEIGQKQGLGGFQTIEHWGSRADFQNIQYVEDSKPRFAVGGISKREGDNDPSDNRLSALQARERVLRFITEPRQAVRLIGPSGLGKSRFVYEFLNDFSTPRHRVMNVSAVYCDYRSVASSLVSVATTLANAGKATLIVIDECPRDIAVQLAEIISAKSSLARIIAIDIDDRPIPGSHWLNLAISPGDDALIEGIIRQHLPDADAGDVSFIKGLCGGFPKIAVLASTRGTDNASVLLSIEDLVERVMKGSGIHDRSEVRALECLSLFESLGTDEDAAHEIDLVADTFAHQSGDQMFEHLARAAQHDLVSHSSRRMAAQPEPIAVFLGSPADGLVAGQHDREVPEGGR